MTIRTGAGLAAAVFLLTGCVVAPQQAVTLNSASLSSSTNKVGVVMTDLPKVDTYLYGASCLLCYGVAAAANSKLTAHAQTLTYEGLADLDKKVAASLTQRGANAILIPSHVVLDKLPRNPASGPGKSSQDFSALGKQYGVNKIVVINITELGFLRTYNAYVPTSDPKAYVKGSGFVVDVPTNAYDWYAPIEIQKASAQGWDEPPQFPGLTNAYFQVLELAFDSYVKPFGGSAAVAAPAATPAPAPDAAPATAAGPVAAAPPAAAVAPATGATTPAAPANQ